MHMYRISLLFGYSILVLSIFSIAFFAESIRSLADDDPDAAVVSFHSPWIYWSFLIYAILGVFSAIILLIGLHERLHNLIFWYVIFFASYCILLLVVAIYCAVLDVEYTVYVIYRWLHFFITVALLMFFTAVYVMIKNETNQYKI